MTTPEEKQKIQEAFHQRVDDDELLNCMRCGFCLPKCPTYIESGYKESHSPRGRIALMKAVSDGLIEPDEDVERSLELCLGCRACEPVCPSGVPYGHLLEEVRDIINQNKKFPFKTRVLRKIVFDHVFPHHHRIKTLTNLLSYYQSTGMQNIMHKTGVLNMFPDTLATMEKVLPQAPNKKKMNKRETIMTPVNTKKKRVAFFTGCLMDSLFRETNDATLELLKIAGCEIVIPDQQVCCGALHGHSGEKERARDLAKKNIKAFEALNVDYILTNAGGCGAFLSDYDHLLKEDEEWSGRAKKLSNKIIDFSSILVALDFHQNHLFLHQQVITYQDSCHLRNVLGIKDAPRRLIKAIDHITFQEMKDADTCCGSAGIYNITESEMSMKILDKKMINTKATHATTIVTSNPGCLLQMKLGVEREGMADKVRIVHLADLLLEAYQPN
ncbi:(Fe-S)-binding protein [Gracilibacillus sp. YIM 98692]|uniref:(Fe-S)-binding protein n=1 Tax=Gracilibacillus sp. YIM 98692 TaxID=2663532 RepID=UPI0013D7C4D5|nr:(Fe-S)-binding protein [Gracilibacillus sp. YIM 98692]